VRVFVVALQVSLPFFVIFGQIADLFATYFFLITIFHTFIIFCIFYIQFIFHKYFCVNIILQIVYVYKIGFEKRIKV
jgi:hypothetical protein